MPSVRPHLIAPVRTVSAFNVASVTAQGYGNGGTLFMQAALPDIPGAWILSNQITTPAGRPPSSEPATRACEGNASAQVCDAYIGSLHLRQTVIYQPASRYWPLQWYETAIYLALAGFCFWWVSAASGAAWRTARGDRRRIRDRRAAAPYRRTAPSRLRA